MKSHSPTNGNIFSDMEVLETISEGSLFRILKARSGTKFIILKASVSPDAMMYSLLKREYEMGCTMSHPCIVSTLGFLEDSQVGPAIVMEYIEGHTMGEYLKVCSKSDKVSIFNDILDAVSYLHHRGVLHNDLKPDNIIVNPHGAARIIDFGLSLSDDSIYKGCIGGSEGFSAPEVLEGKGPAGASSDIYSIGLLMEYIFDRKKYDSIISRCCQTDPSKRFQSITSLKRAISIKKWFPVAALSVIFAIFILTITLPQKVGNVISESSHRTLKDRLRTEMDSFYIPARDSMSRQQTFIAASAFKGEYLLRYVNFSDSIPADQRLACEEIFAEQSAVLDSLLLSLMSPQ